MATQTSHSSELPNGLRYYLLRDSVMVPLVPVDQLPFQLQGIPRQLTHRQLSDENWKLLLETQHPVTSFSVQAPSGILQPPLTPSPKTRFLAPDHHIRNVEAPQPKSWLTFSKTAQTSPSHPQASYSPGSEHTTNLTESIASIYQKDAQRFGYRPPYPSGIEPDSSKKVFCTHWIKTGECAFTSVGCKYKHEMPTMERLRELGFTQQPRWWKEKSAIIARGPTWMQRRLASGNKQDETLDQMPTLSVFPDPSTFRTRQTEENGRMSSRQPARSILQRNFMSEQSGILPIRPVLDTFNRRESQISNLIDFEEPPAPPPSLHLSNSSASDISYDTQVPPSRSPASSPASPVFPATKPIDIEPSTVPKLAERKQSKEESPSQPVARRYSSKSWASDHRRDVQLTQPLDKVNPTLRRPARRINAPIKRQEGLTKSRHAAFDHNVSSSEVKNGEPHIKNANHNMPQHKGNEATVTKSQMKVEQRRGNEHHKERVKQRPTRELKDAIPAHFKQVSGKPDVVQ